MSIFKNVFFIIGIVVSTFSLSSQSLLADSGTPRSKWTKVQMQSETVDITLSESKVIVKAFFTMKNHGKTRNVLMGYPLGEFEQKLNDFQVSVPETGKKINSKAVKMEEFTKKMWARLNLGVDAEEIDHVLGPDGLNKYSNYKFEGPYKLWHVFSIPIKSGETVSFEVNYWVKTSQVKTKNADLLHYMYTLVTGATWKGLIEQALVKVKLQIPKQQIISCTPAGYVWKGNNMITWKFKNFKPNENINIIFRPKKN